MTTALQEPPGHAVSAPAVRLRHFAAAMRLSFTWFGVRKTLTPQQKEQAAESFGAEGQFLSAGKKLIDTKHLAFKAVTSIRNCLVCWWIGRAAESCAAAAGKERCDAADHFARGKGELHLWGGN